MTELATIDVPIPSTVLDADTPTGPSGGGVPKLPIETPSLRDMIAEEVTKDAEPKDDTADKGADEAKGKAEKEPGKAPEKPKEEAQAPEVKDDKKAPERAPDGKFAAKQAEADEAKPSDAAEKSEAKAEERSNGHIPAPSKFLPDAKEKWLNTPRSVQRDVDNALREHETELTKYREAAERYEPIRQYDDLVRQNGRAGVHETLQEVAQLEDLVAKNPVAALNQVLLRAGPRKADGSPVTLYELAQYVVQSGQDGYNKMAAQPQQQPSGGRQPDPEVAQLKEQIARMQEQQLAATVIEPFKAANPRYDDLQDDIAFFLQSGKIPTSLSPSDRLAAAYDMAVRINPASHANDAAVETDLEPARRADDDLSGSKSIKSAPGAVSTDMEPVRGGSIRELLESELKRTKRS